MLEKRVYSAWAFTENANEKAQINIKIYRELKPKVKICHKNYFTHRLEITPHDLEQYCCIVYDGSGYAHQRYCVLSNPHNLTLDELALVADGGCLCFGYRGDDRELIIYTD